jgi:uncharacterized protein
VPDSSKPEGALPDRDDLRKMLSDVGKMYMPFGKFGPKKFPPRGVPLCDLPPEYLHWFKCKGFPKGRLGELMEIVYQAKADGADAIFDQIRAKNGGRHPLRNDRQRAWEFGDQ